MDSLASTLVLASGSMSASTMGTCLNLEASCPRPMTTRFISIVSIPDLSGTDSGYASPGSSQGYNGRATYSSPTKWKIRCIYASVRVGFVSATTDSKAVCPFMEDEYCPPSSSLARIDASTLFGRVGASVRRRLTRSNRVTATSRDGSERGQRRSAFPTSPNYRLSRPWSTGPISSSSTMV